MGELSEEIKTHSDAFEKAEFESLCENLTLMSLEEALNKTLLSVESVDTLRLIVWKYINKKDSDLFRKLTLDVSYYALAELFQIIIQSASNTLSVVTTNYDRLAEYAADLIDATTVTGFEGNMIRKLSIPNAQLQQRRIRARERIVNLWKVHGSLDWFTNEKGEIVSYPSSKNIPANHKPLIIVPGNGKYTFTHNEPYRDIITQADLAFSKAGSFLCIGYGFNDDHIQPKLVEQIKRGKPIVALCKEATEACKQTVMTSEVRKFAVIELAAGGKTKVSFSDNQGIYDGDFWNLSEFIKTMWR
jgi:hypothetical protein